MHVLSAFGAQNGSNKMSKVATVAFSGALAAGALALASTGASARIVCNADGDCWHTTTVYEYPAEASIVVRPDNWRWKEGEKFRWREHEGRGYWHGGGW